MNNPSTLSLCIDRRCPTKDSCQRWLTAASTGGIADFNRDEGAEKCSFGFVPIGQASDLKNVMAEQQNAEYTAMYQQ